MGRRRKGQREVGVERDTERVSSKETDGVSDGREGGRVRERVEKATGLCSVPSVCC